MDIRRRRRRRRRHRHLSGGRQGLEAEEELCDCHEQRAWEPVDLERLLPKEVVATLTASLMAVASTAKVGDLAR